MAQSTGVIAAIVGTAALLIGLGIVTGIVVNVVNKGETHKEQMMASPPPPPASSRQLFESERLFQAPKGNSFKFTPTEKAAFASPRLRPLSR